MQHILFCYSTWFILGINQRIPHDWNGLRSLLLMPATCNFWCSTTVVKAQSCKVPKISIEAWKCISPGEVQWFQLRLLSTFLALKYFLSQQHHMLFLFPPFFAWHLKNCTPDSKEIFLLLLFFLSVGETSNNRERFRTAQYLIQNANLCGL